MLRVRGLERFNCGHESSAESCPEIPRDGAQPGLLAAQRELLVQFVIRLLEHKYLLQIPGTDVVARGQALACTAMTTQQAFSKQIPAVMLSILRLSTYIGAFTFRREQSQPR